MDPFKFNPKHKYEHHCQIWYQEQFLTSIQFIFPKKSIQGVPQTWLTYHDVQPIKRHNLRVWSPFLQIPPPFKCRKPRINPFWDRVLPFRHTKRWLISFLPAVCVRVYFTRTFHPLPTHNKHCRYNVFQPSFPNFSPVGGGTKATRSILIKKWTELPASAIAAPQSLARFQEFFLQLLDLRYQIASRLCRKKSSTNWITFFMVVN